MVKRNSDNGFPLELNKKGLHHGFSYSKLAAISLLYLSSLTIDRVFLFIKKKMKDGRTHFWFIELETVSTLNSKPYESVILV